MDASVAGGNDEESDITGIQYNTVAVATPHHMRTNSFNSKSEEHVQVYIRLRPLLDSDPTNNANVDNAKLPNGRTDVVAVDKEQTMLRFTGTNGKGFDLTYNHIFTGRAKQSEVYSKIAPSIDAVVNGFNTTIFAYGQVQGTL